jgi:hypothetical protein
VNRFALPLALAIALSGCEGFQAVGGHDAAVDGGPCDGACMPQPLATGLILPTALAVNGSDVYWLELGAAPERTDGTLTRVEKGSGCPAPGGSCRDLLEMYLPGPFWIALGPTAVCWIETFNADNESEIYCFDIGTGATRIVATGLHNSNSLAIDGNDLFWTNANQPGEVMTTPLAARSTTPPVALAKMRPRPTSVAVDGNALFWSEAGAVMTAARDGSNPRMVAANQTTPFAITTYGGFVYWSNGSNELWRAPEQAGDPPAMLLAAAPQPSSIAADASGLYWIEGGLPPNYLDQRLMRAGLDGSGGHAIATGLPAVSTIALDGDFVYWLQQGTPAANYTDGALLKLPKRL